MTIKHVERAISDLEDFVSPETTVSVTRVMQQFNQKTAEIQRELTEPDVLSLLEALIKDDPYLKTARIEERPLTNPLASFNSVIAYMGTKAVVRLCRENKAWVLQYSVNE
ncbi:MAG TPA: hypothetical protein VJ246_03570 [Patescibacteria group bacterium]|nr:hypothetical protein [Patescibacteria group bacterium]